MLHKVYYLQTYLHLWHSHSNREGGGGVPGAHAPQFSVSATSTLYLKLIFIKVCSPPPPSNQNTCKEGWIHVWRCLLTVADFKHTCKHIYKSCYPSFISCTLHTHLYTSCPAGQTAFIPTVVDWLYCIWGSFVLDNPRGLYADKVGMISTPTHMYNIDIHCTFIAFLYLSILLFMTLTHTITGSCKS